MKNFSTWDIETTEWNKFKIAGIYDGENKILCHSVEEIINTMKRKGGVYFAHYGGGFDNLFLLQLLKKYKLSVKNIGAKLIRISVYYHNSKKKLFEIRDSYPILPQGLDKLSKDLLGRGKMKIDRKKIESYSDEELRDYVLDDCVLLYECIKKYLEKTEQEKLGLTIAGETKKDFKKTFDIKEIQIPSYLDADLRESYSGGRVEVFKRYGENLNHYDVKSMFSSVMYEKEYPAGLCIETDSFKDDKLGIYNCNIITPQYLEIPFLHTYDAEGKIIFPLGRFSGCYTSAEILKARSLGYEIEILNGWYFTKKVKPFKAYIDKWYGLKQEAENNGDNALRTIAKLYLNSLYGKFGQRRSFQKLMFKDKPLKYYIKKYGEVKDVLEDLNYVIIDDESTSKYTSVQVASFITAYSRIKLYEGFEVVHSLGGSVYYCDTDCMITDVIIPTGKNLGDWDYENKSPIEEGIFLFPKFYSYRMADGSEIERHKGLSSKYGFDTYRSALDYDEYMYTIFSERWNGIASILECKQRHLEHLTVIDKHREVRTKFTKRILEEGFNTRPLIIEK